ncbi:MAG: NusG domain II-containing protein [Eubacteriales bacterium]|nr:NusG domain II-containing protein [Eubacteriales bacterium]
MEQTNDKKELLRFFNKADVILLIVLLLLGAGSIFASKIIPTGADTVVISVDGEEYGRFPLAADRVIDVDTVFGHNTVTISGARVSVTESDCPNHDCEDFGVIAKAGQSIMCLPHRMLVRIDGETDVDAVIY